MRRLAWVPLALFAVGCASPEVASRPPILPLRVARLYETGVAYFEREGKAEGPTTSLPVPAGHLDDALKTLVVLGEGGKASVRGVELESSVGEGMARALARLPLEAGKPVRYRDMLASLRGNHVAVTLAGEALEGRIVDVLEHEPEKVDEKSARSSFDPDDRLTLLLMTDRGELRRVVSKDVRSIRPTDPAVLTRYEAAMGALSPGAARADRLVRVLGEATAPVRLGYVAEAPIWRATYRVVLGAPREKSTLQGWALLHNDTDEHWRGVRVELTSGRPDSFLFPLAAPRYARRELVEPENPASTVPQLLGKTVDAMWGDHTGDMEGAGGFGVSGYGAGGGGVGHGIGLGRIGTVGHGAGAGDGESSLLEVGNLAKVSEASGVEGAALFTYTLASPIDLRAHGTALVPFLHRGVSTEQVTYLATTSASPRAAVRLTNDTGQTLPAGPVSLFADRGFAGETALDRVKPGEQRLLTFAHDLDVRLEQQRGRSESRVKALRLVGSSMEEHYVKSETSELSLENRSPRDKVVLVGLPIGKNASIDGADRTDFDPVTKHPMAVFVVPAHATVTRTLTTREGLQRSRDVGGLSTAWIDATLEASDLEAKARATLEKLKAKTRAREAGVELGKKVAREREQTDKDLERVREHLKALGDKAAGVGQPLVRKILDLEAKLSDLRARGEKLDAQRVEDDKAVVEALAPLSPPAK